MTKGGSSTKAGAIADYEKLGAFYLGRRFDIREGGITPEPILYDARDLLTHAVCVGMTGSGKTGLGVALLEEAAIDGVPIIAIDPKGDMANLMLTFPQLRPGDFEPWIDPGDAARKGRTVEEHAKWTADLWRGGLADWGQDPSRIARFAGSADRTIYTPASRSGRPVTVLRSFAAPPPEVAADDEFRRERVQVTVSSLLALLGVKADPVRSREHILLSTILDTAWREGRDLDIPSLIREIQDPPFTRVGVMELDTFYSQDDRFELAMMLNNLVAAPGFSAWMEGEPLDIDRLLYGPNGRPRISIFSIAHLSESERMFFVTVLLNEIVSWVRSQPGSRTLRALLYMDEIFGYFPPTAEPPSKRPMLTLLKQARAHGLGVVLCTQNPVDLDYKGLSNTGTWFIGRLQTERDKARVLDGLEGASATSGVAFERGEMDRVLSGLQSRVFLMNNVHEDGPEIMHTRWVLSYLSGPMTREQIQRVQSTEVPPAPSPVRPSTRAPESAPRPVVPPDVPEGFLNPPVGANAVRYRPALLARATLHYAKARSDIDEWRQVSVLSPLDDDSVGSPWDEAEVLPGGAPPVTDDPVAGAAFDPLPTAATKAKRYTRWSKMLKTHLYRTRPLELWRCKKPKLISRPGESEDVFRGRLNDLRREDRDLAMEKLRTRFAPKVKRLQDRITRAEERVDREKEQLSHQRTQTAISVGATVLGALFGRKAKSVGTVGRASSALRGASRSKREAADVVRATGRLEDLRQQLIDLEVDFEDRLVALRDDLETTEPEIERLAIAPRKSDLAVDDLLLAWVPESGAPGQ